MNVLQLTAKAEATYVTNQVQALADLGVESDVVEVPGGAGSDGRSPFDYLRFCRIVRDELSTRHDLVHANFGLTIPGAIAQRRVPVVTSLVGTDLMGRYGGATKQLTRFCDEVIVVNDEMRDLVPGDAHVIPYGIDVQMFRPMDRTSARKKIGWPTDRYCVLFPYSTERPVKNYKLAERVVEMASEQLGEEIELRSITGLDYSLIPAYMNAADTLLLTSHREGSPSTVKEALACNTPVVATPVGDVPARLSRVDHCATSDSVVELAEALCDAVTARERPNGRDAVRDATLERMGERILNVYERTVERPMSSVEASPRRSSAD